MNLEEALKRIKELEKEKSDLEKENNKLKAELFNERKEKEKALLALIHQKEKKTIAYVRQFTPKTEKINKVIINEVEEIIKKDKETSPRKKKFEDIDFEKYVTNEIVLKPDALTCPTCGKDLVKIGEKIRYQIDADPINVRVTRIIKETYKCPDCNKKDNKVYYPLVNEVFDGSILTPGFAAYLAYHKYELGIPFNHLEKHFANTLGIPISKSNMADYMAKTADVLTPIYERMKSDLLNTDTKVIHADETTLTLSKQANPERKKSYVFVYASSFYDKNQIHIYEFNESRSIDPESNYLKDFNGYIECDDYAGYDKLRKAKSNIKLQRCWAHARRKYMDIIKSLPKEVRNKSIAFKIVEKMNKLFAIEEKIHENKLFGQDLIDSRRKEELPIINEIHDLVFNYTPKQGSAFEGAINYTKKVWNDLLPYLDEPYLELSNNLAERCVKPFVVNRKVFQTSGSEAGAIYTVKLFSIIRTAIINGLDPYRYIKYVLENIKNKSIDDLLPYSKEMSKLA